MTTKDKYTEVPDPYYGGMASYCAEIVCCAVEWYADCVWFGGGGIGRL